MMCCNQALYYFLAAFGAFVLWSTFTSSVIQDRSAIWRLIYSVAVLVGVLVVGIIAGMSVSALSVILTKGKGLVGEHQLEITEQGLKESTIFNCSLNTLDGMKGLKETGSFVLLRITDHYAHLIPKNRPLSEGDLRVFVEHFRQRMKEANKPVNATARSSLVESTSTPPTHHL